MPVDADELERRRRSQNLRLACALGGVASLAMYPLALVDGIVPWRLGLVHLSVLLAYVGAGRGHVNLASWLGCLAPALMVLDPAARAEELSASIYYLTISVVFAAAVMRSKDVMRFTALLVALVAGLWVVRGMPGGPEALRLISVSAVLLICGAIGTVAASGSERLVGRLVESLHEADAQAVRRVIAEEHTARSKAADAAKSAFLASMSHELRTPLNAILGYAELVGEEIEDKAPESVEDLERIVTSGQHLRRLIDDVLDLSKIEAGRFEVRLENVPLQPILEEVARTAAPLVATRGNTLVLPDDLNGLDVRVDQTRLKQVLLNLIGNSAKFTDGGRIEVQVETEPERAQILVIDDGAGMNPEELKSAFDPFSQVGDSSRPEGGTGLGLPLARRFTEAMGGTLTATSEKGRGTQMRVRIRLPP